MRTVGRADGRMDMTKLVFVFHNFLNAPENEWSCNSTPLYVFMVFIVATLPFATKLHFLQVVVLDNFACGFVWL